MGDRLLTALDTTQTTSQKILAIIRKDPSAPKVALSKHWRETMARRKTKSEAGKSIPEMADELTCETVSGSMV